MTAPVLGFIGLGAMGQPMSGRLVDAGYEVIGFDAAGTEARLPRGAATATSPGDVAARAEIVFLSLPDGSTSRSVCAQMVRATPRRAEMIVDLSTIGIAASQEIHAMLKESGIIYVDAPVSGGVRGAKAGSLAVMVGAEASVFERLQPMLAVLAANRFRMGDAAGQGQAMKILNNFLSATNLAATSEAVLFGGRMGLDLRQMIDVINVSTGCSTASTQKFPRSIIPGSYDYGFAAALMTKDVTLFGQSIEASGVSHEIATLMTHMWQEFNAACPGVDFTYMYEHLKNKA